MEHRFCLDEILGKVSEMINDGYHYFLDFGRGECGWLLHLQMVRPE